MIGFTLKFTLNMEGEYNIGLAILTCHPMEEGKVPSNMAGSQDAPLHISIGHLVNQIMNITVKIMYMLTIIQMPIGMMQLLHIIVFVVVSLPPQHQAHLYMLLPILHHLVIQLLHHPILQLPSSNPTTAPSSNPTDDMWIADSPINQHVICEGDGCSLPANSTAADTEGVDSAFESSTINQQIQETLQRSQDFIRRYLNAGRQRIDSIKSKLNSTLAEQRGTKQFLTKFMMDRQTDYASAKEALQNKLKDATTEL